MAKLLYIDTKDYVNHYVQYMFEPLDIDVIHITNVDSTMFLLSIGKYDGIIIEPGIKDSFNQTINYDKGFQLLQSIKTLYKDIPIIIYTGVVTLETKLKTNSIKYDKFVLKSIDETHLIKAVITQLNLDHKLLSKIPTQSNRKVNIFISYAKEDFDRAFGIYELLEHEKFSPWIDKKKILPGQDWDFEIQTAIQKSHFFLACLSTNSVSKMGYIQKELKKGFNILDNYPEGSIYLIPIRLEECAVPGRLSGIQWCNVYEPSGMDKVLEAIKSGCAAKGLLLDEVSSI
jgi:DNA-binding NarL/FixJ family response regulator